MADALIERGCDVRLAGIEFTDKRWAERFTLVKGRNELVAADHLVQRRPAVPDEVKRLGAHNNADR